MLAFTINDTKQFMTHLLKGDTFDLFLFRQGEILSFANFTIDGRKDPDFEEQKGEGYCLWSDIKPFVFQAVKGKRLPKSMKLVLALPEKNMTAYLNAKAVFLNILFRDGSLLCTTATAQKNFSLDKQADALWESYVLDFFQEKQIGITM